MSRAAVIAFFAALCAAGVAAHGGYGIGWDEMAMRYIGTTTLDHLGGNDAAWPLPPEIRFHGAVIEVALAFLERGFGLADLRDVFLFRHLAGFMMFAAGAVLLYLLALRHFRARGPALLAAAVFALAPRLFGDSFVNTKDIPAATLWTAAMLTLVRLLDRPSPGRAAAHAGATALLLAVRAPGLLLAALSGFSLALSLAGPPEDRRRASAVLGLYLVATAALTVALWPFLWNAPLANLREALAVMRRIPWDVPVRYLGRDISASDLPWHYAPVWIAITTPLPVLGCLVVGLGVAARSVARGDPDPDRRRDLALCLAWLGGPFAAVAVLRSVIYDGWRHLYFVWPAAALLATEGAVAVARAAARRLARVDARVRIAAATAGLAVLLVPQAVFLFRWHPFGHVYFSVPPALVRGRFELDYWGLSYRQALEAVLARDPAPLVPYAAPNDPAWDNLAILRPADRARLAPQSELAGARYYLTNFRGEHDAEPPGRPELAIVVDGLEILGVYRLGDDPPAPPPVAGARGPAFPWRIRP